MEGSIMQSLTRNVERRLIETPLPPTLAVLLAGMLALIITFALLALLAVCGWDCLGVASVRGGSEAPAGASSEGPNLSLSLAGPPAPAETFADTSNQVP